VFDIAASRSYTRGVTLAQDAVTSGNIFSHQVRCAGNAETFLSDNCILQMRFAYKNQK